MIRRSWTVLLILLVASVPAIAGAQVRPSDTPLDVRYRAIVDTYRTGQVEKAVTDLLGLDLDAVVGRVNRFIGLVSGEYPGDPRLDAAFFRTTAMLHADAAFRCGGNRQNTEASTHMDLARRLIDTSEPRKAVRAGAFRRRWYLATAVILTRQVTAPDMLDYFEDAMKKLPDDVPLLTAAGWFSERSSDGAALRGADIRRMQAARRLQQDSAVRLLTKALALDPNAAEAALRLARVEAAMGRNDQAIPRLLFLLARSDVDTTIRYLASLVLGDLHERRGDLRDAERLYRQAIALDDVAQSARVALAQLLYAAGDPDSAAGIMEPAVTNQTKRDRNDPWADYQLGYPEIGRIMFDQLRDAVQR